jgi:hypothetical protein
MLRSSSVSSKVSFSSSMRSARRRSAFDPTQRLALHELTEELDQCQHQLRQAALHILGIRLDTTSSRSTKEEVLSGVNGKVVGAPEQLGLRDIRRLTHRCTPPAPGLAAVAARRFLRRCKEATAR